MNLCKRPCDYNECWGIITRHRRISCFSHMHICNDAHRDQMCFTKVATQLQQHCRTEHQETERTVRDAICGILLGMICSYGPDTACRNEGIIPVIQSIQVRLCREVCIAHQFKSVRFSSINAFVINIFALRGEQPCHWEPMLPCVTRRAKACIEIVGAGAPFATEKKLVLFEARARRLQQRSSVLARTSITISSNVSSESTTLVKFSIHKTSLTLLCSPMKLRWERQREGCVHSRR